MRIQLVGMGLLLVAAGFFLNWGQPYTNGSHPFDSIAGVLFSIIGFSLLYFRETLTRLPEQRGMNIPTFQQDTREHPAGGDSQ